MSPKFLTTIKIGTKKKKNSSSIYNIHPIRPTISDKEKKKKF